MKECIIFLDESGDLGWKFDAPYRFGGSSRYITISSVIVPPQKSHLLVRAIKELYEKFGWNTKKEKKWALMDRVEKYYFAKYLSKFIKEHLDIEFLAITAFKPNVGKIIHKNSNRLYSYMIGMMLLKEMHIFKKAIFTPDLRSVKAKHEDSLYNYLTTKLWLELGYQIEFINNPTSSDYNKGIQFVDMFSGMIQQHFEDNDSECFLQLPPDRVKTQTLFMPNHIHNKEKILIETIT